MAPTVLLLERSPAFAKKLREQLEAVPLLVLGSTDPQSLAALLKSGDLAGVIMGISGEGEAEFPLLTKILSRPAYKGLPVVLLVENEIDSVERRAIELGIGHILKRPLEPAKVVKRFKNLLDVYTRTKRKSLAKDEDSDSRQRETAALKSSSFSGDLAKVSVAEIGQVFTLGTKTGLIMLRQGVLTGTLYFLNGKLHHAVQIGLGAADTKDGEPAALSLLSWRKGTFSVEFTAVDKPQNIKRRYEMLVLEAMRLLDERTRSEPQAEGDDDLADLLRELKMDDEVDDFDVDDDPEFLSGLSRDSGITDAPPSVEDLVKLSETDAGSPVSNLSGENSFESVLAQLGVENTAQAPAPARNGPAAEAGGSDRTRLAEAPNTDSSNFDDILADMGLSPAVPAKPQALAVKPDLPAPTPPASEPIPLAPPPPSTPPRVVKPASDSFGDVLAELGLSPGGPAAAGSIPDKAPAPDESPAASPASPNPAAGSPAPQPASRPPVKLEKVRLATDVDPLDDLHFSFDIESSPAIPIVRTIYPEPPPAPDTTASEPQTRIGDQTEPGTALPDPLPALSTSDVSLEDALDAIDISAIGQPQAPLPAVKSAPKPQPEAPAAAFIPPAGPPPNNLLEEIDPSELNDGDAQLLRKALAFGIQVAQESIRSGEPEVELTKEEIAAKFFNKDWYVPSYGELANRAGKPLNQANMEALIRKGFLHPNVPVYKRGQPVARAHEFPELRPVFDALPEIEHLLGDGIELPDGEEDRLKARATQDLSADTQHPELNERIWMLPVMEEYEPACRTPQSLRGLMTLIRKGNLSPEGIIRRFDGFPMLAGQVPALAESFAHRHPSFDAAQYRSASVPLDREESLIWPQFEMGSDGPMLSTKRESSEKKKGGSGRLYGIIAVFVVFLSAAGYAAWSMRHVVTPPPDGPPKAILVDTLKVRDTYFKTDAGQIQYRIDGEVRRPADMLNGPWALEIRLFDKFSRTIGRYAIINGVRIDLPAEGTWEDAMKGLTMDQVGTIKQKSRLLGDDTQPFSLILEKPPLEISSNSVIPRNNIPFLASSPGAN